MTLIGARNPERKQRQPILIDATIEVDIEEGVAKDNLALAVDYSLVVKSIISFLETSSYKLLESLAYHLSHYLLKEFPIKSVQLTAHKPLATNGLAQVSIEYYCKA